MGEGAYLLHVQAHSSLLMLLTAEPTQTLLLLLLHVQLTATAQKLARHATTAPFFKQCCYNLSCYYYRSTAQCAEWQRDIASSLRICMQINAVLLRCDQQ